MTGNINEICYVGGPNHEWEMGEESLSYFCHNCSVKMVEYSEPSDTSVLSIAELAEQFSHENHMVNMRQRSGSVDSTDPLVGFLYILIRDHLPLGVIEEIMLAHVEYDQSDNQFTNGWLANYCKDLATRLNKTK